MLPNFSAARSGFTKRQSHLVIPGWWPAIRTTAIVPGRRSLQKSPHYQINRHANPKIQRQSSISLKHLMTECVRQVRCDEEVNQIPQQNCQEHLHPAVNHSGTHRFDLVRSSAINCQAHYPHKEALCRTSFLVSCASTTRYYYWLYSRSMFRSHSRSGHHTPAP